MIPNGGFPMKHQKLSTTPEISKRMANVHLKASKAETDLAKELWRRGLRYRKNYRKLPGSPDIAILKHKIAVFVDVPYIDTRWLTDLEHGCGYQSKYAPKVWKEWVDKGKYTPLITEKNPIQYRKANEQLPTGGTLEFSMLEHIISFFVDPYTFEQFACKLVQIMDSNIVSIEQTRRTRDGGRDAVGQYRVGLATGGVELEFALEAKRYSLNNSVGVKETSRLISRIKHRQFGIFVTTSFVGDQAYKEIIEDQHPIVVISGKDIVDILISAGINSVDILNDWLESNFGLH